MTGGNEVDTSTVLGKVLGVLEAFTPADDAVPLADLSRRTGIPKGTLHRLTAALVVGGLLERKEGGYRLGTHLFELGMVASAQHGLRELALPFVEDLYESTHETVHLGILEGTEAICIEKISGHRCVPASSRVGGRMPLYCTAIGKALLAFSPSSLLEQVVAAGMPRRTPRTIVAPGLLRRELARVVAAGSAYDYEESTVGVACVAAPVFDAAGEVVAAVSVAGAFPQFRPQRSAKAVRMAARSLSRTVSALSTGAEAHLAWELKDGQRPVLTSSRVGS
jgi:DNA-binding IclR family transcriptional regulator